MTPPPRPPCAAAVPGIAGWAECGAPAAGTHAYACGLGHLIIASTCAAHQPKPGMVGCRQCLDAGHDCLIMVVAVAL